MEGNIIKIINLGITIFAIGKKSSIELLRTFVDTNCNRKISVLDLIHVIKTFDCFAFAIGNDSSCNYDMDNAICFNNEIGDHICNENDFIVVTTIAHPDKAKELFSPCEIQLMEDNCTWIKRFGL